MQLYNEGDFARLAPLHHSGTPEPYRSDFRRDYARILHSPAFRRLQRKLQLFPADESDFFRNRLTHSLEVAQIAKSIAARLNYIIKGGDHAAVGQLDLELVELAALAHDLGHPPFGHTGEHALHLEMYRTGGFEGNAQTLRILSKLEKRQTRQASDDNPDFTEFWDGSDQRAGLNLCFRSLAAILKYDNCIPVMGSEQLRKGYYKSEENLVQQVKQAVLGDEYENRKKDKFRVIEMQIMDLADDIAYSTFDFEDALKAGFVSPLDLLLQLNSNNDLRDAVARKLFKTEHKRDYPAANQSPSSSDKSLFDEIQVKMLISVIGMMNDYFEETDLTINQTERELFLNGSTDQKINVLATIAVLLQKISNQVVNNGYIRAQLTSDLIGRRLRTIGIKVDPEVPPLSEVTIPTETRFEIDVLKHLTYELHIKSPRLKLVEYRGHQIVRELFKCFEQDKSGDMLPSDWRSRLSSIRGYQNEEEIRQRLICDFVAGMTDAYALDVYERLKTTNRSAIFRPL